KTKGIHFALSSRRSSTLLLSSTATESWGSLAKSGSGVLIITTLAPLAANASARTRAISHVRWTIRTVRLSRELCGSIEDTNRSAGSGLDGKGHYFSAGARPAVATTMLEVPPEAPSQRPTGLSFRAARLGDLGMREPLLQVRLSRVLQRRDYPHLRPTAWRWPVSSVPSQCHPDRHQSSRLSAPMPDRTPVPLP